MEWRLEITRGGSLPLYRQVAEAIEAAIAGGRLGPGERIPSATSLARLAGIGRPTAVRALRELERAGLIVAHVGRGSFVAEAPRADDDAIEAAVLTPPDLERIMGRLRASHMKSIARLARVRPPGDVIDLRPGYPPDACVPDLLPRLAAEVLAGDTRRLGRYVPGGLPELVEAIAAWLTTRGCPARPEEILVTNGSQDAISFLGTWAARRGRPVRCETPTWWGIPHAFSFCGHAIASVRWAGEQLALAPAPGPGLLYCCPDFNNPTGRCLTPAARTAVARAADRDDLMVLVDDIFRDLRFAGAEPPSLSTYLPPAHRILVGSFSKSLMPGLRVGFIAAAPALVEELASIKQYVDLGGPPLMQAITAAFLDKSHEAHLERVRAYYAERCHATCDALDRHMPDGVRFTRPEGGFHLWVELPEDYSCVPVYLEALEHGVAVAPGPMHDVDGGYRNCFRISYGHATPQELDRAVATIARITRSVLSRRPEGAGACSPL